MDMRRSWKISLGVMRHAWEQPPPCFLIQNIKRILTLKPQIFCMPNRGGGRSHACLTIQGKLEQNLAPEHGK